MWKEQYERMLRGFKEIEEIYDITYDLNNPNGLAIYGGQGNYQEIRDTVIHFFQDCFHLRDWLINTLPLSEADKNYIKEVFEKESSFHGLPLCRDVANASKHFSLNKTFSVDQGALLIASGTSVVVAPETTFQLKFKIDLPGSGNQINVLELARMCIEEWDGILKTRNLL